MTSAPTPRVHPRRVAFEYASLPKHWLAGDAIATHFANGINLLFPHGERFFVRSVQKHLHRIDDPTLRADAKAFFGQEGTHAREHERFFDVLRDQGYEIDDFLRRYEGIASAIERRMPDALQLAVTAASEHYTALLGHAALTNGLFETAHPTVRDLLLWHAAEEIEHKAVAFDVLQATNPSYALRMAGMALGSTMLVAFWLAATARLLRQDGYGLREIAAAFRGFGANDQMGLRALGRGIAMYARRDFHPWQEDDLHLAREYFARVGMEAAA
ncbi:MAG: metal-dependent hydrolase [Polyangiaceae bacterium]